MLNQKEIKKFNSLVDGNDASLSLVFKTLGDPKRCRIYRLLIKSKGLHVSDIARIMDISLPSTSQHLKALELTGLVSRERQGKNILFSVNKENEIVKALVRSVL